MKRPIEPSEIRKGDLIRWEYGIEVGHGELALEYRATGHAHGKGGPGQHYLLDRPEPAVELPTEPTLGWLTWYAGEESSGLGIYRTLLSTFHDMGNGDITDEAAAGAWGAEDVAAFTPATAVPTEALDELGKAHSALGTLTRSGHAIRDFLEAVDKAGESV